MKAPTQMETAAAVPRSAPLRARPARGVRRRSRAEMLAMTEPPVTLEMLATPPLPITPAEAQARAADAFGMWRKYVPGGKADWDAIDAALAEGKRERIAAVRRMTDRWHWNKRDQCWEKRPA